MMRHGILSALAGFGDHREEVVLPEPLSIYRVPDLTDQGTAGVDATTGVAWTGTGFAGLVQGETVAGGGEESAYKAATNAEVSVPSDPAHTLAGGVTMAAYVYPIDNNRRQAIFACGNFTQTGDYSLEIWSDGNLSGWHTSAPSTRHDFWPGGVLPVSPKMYKENGPRLLVMSFGPAGGKLYLDGLRVGNILPETNSWNPNLPHLFFNNISGSADMELNGYGDQVMIWGEQLSDAQVALIPPAKIIGPPDSLYRLDAASGALPDDGILGIDGTIAGTAILGPPMAEASTSSWWPNEGAGVATIPADAAHASNDLTFSVIVQPEDVTGDVQMIVDRTQNGSFVAAGSFVMELGRTTGGEQDSRQLRVAHTGSDGTINGLAGPVLDIGTAYRVTMRFASTGIYLYVDGVLVDSNEQSIHQGVGMDDAADWTLGERSDGIRPLAAGLDELSIWVPGLSPGQIQAQPPAISVTSPIEPATLTLLGSWPMSETTGNTAADATGSNDASIDIPTWTIATHEWERRAISVGATDDSKLGQGGNGAIEVSNGGPVIPMIAGYKTAAASLVLYVCPLGEQRGTQHWDITSAGFGREFLAYCDDGSTPGSFAIERRWFSSTEWRLDGYVRNGSGTAVRFSGGHDGLAGALLPVDTARRVTLTQGAAGAKLYLDDTEVGSLPAVTSGWSALATSIYLGSSSDQGHANDRSPLWGRLDEVEVWSGQLGPTEVQALDAATSSLLWKYPSDFVGGSTDINIADYAADPQGAIDAADSAGRYVYQAEGDATWYTVLNNAHDNGVRFRPGARGMINVRLKRPDNQNNYWFRMLNIGTQGSGLMGTSHGDPFAGSGGWKFIGVQIDGNGRGQDWDPDKNNPSSSTYTGQGLQQAWAFALPNAGTTVTTTFDHCQVFDNTSDGLSWHDGNISLAKSCRMYGCFRGSFVSNLLGDDILVSRGEMTFDARIAGYHPNGGGHDVEPYGSGGLIWKMYDCWMDGDFDDESEQTSGSNSEIYYYNVHSSRAGHYIISSGENVTDPVNIWKFFYGTLGYHAKGFNNTGNWPACWWRGPSNTDGTGLYFEGTSFVAAGEFYCFNEYHETPDASEPYQIQVETGPVEGPRLWTMKNCEWRSRNVPAGLPQADLRALTHGSRSTAITVELDGVTIGAEFADNPFAMGGVTVRHRNVVHERTLDTTPWTGAGAEVPI